MSKYDCNPGKSKLQSLQFFVQKTVRKNVRKSLKQDDSFWIKKYPDVWPPYKLCIVKKWRSADWSADVFEFEALCSVWSGCRRKSWRPKNRRTTEHLHSLKMNFILFGFQDSKIRFNPSFSDHSCKKTVKTVPIGSNIIVRLKCWICFLHRANFLKIYRGGQTLTISAHEKAPMRAFSVFQKRPKIAKMTPNDLLTLGMVFPELLRKTEQNTLLVS